MLGYDIGGRLTGVLGADEFYEARHSTHSFAPPCGAAATGVLAGLPEQ
jgi:hypothetical protein